MGKVFTHTARKSMSPEQVEKGLEAFRNPSKWPDWNSNAKNLLATKAESIDEGDHLAIFQVIKGSLIETKWLSVRLEKEMIFVKLSCLEKVKVEMKGQLLKD